MAKQKKQTSEAAVREIRRPRKRILELPCIAGRRRPRKGPRSPVGGLLVRTPSIGGAENALGNSYSQIASRFWVTASLNSFSKEIQTSS